MLVAQNKQIDLLQKDDARHRIEQTDTQLHIRRFALQQQISCDLSHDATLFSGKTYPSLPVVEANVTVLLKLPS